MLKGVVSIGLSSALDLVKYTIVATLEKLYLRGLSCHRTLGVIVVVLLEFCHNTGILEGYAVNRQGCRNKWYTINMEG